MGPLAAHPGESPALDVDALIDDPQTRIIVCCGSGGVGKTTTSAALALRAAERGRKVVVLTIDPARRLAQSMGIEELDNTPRPVADVDATAGGSLDAMMLDMKSTFDEVVLSQATPEKAKAILENPFYIVLSTSFAGTQEYMAMVTGALTKVLGAQVLTDLQTFVAALDTVFGGFRARAQRTYALLQAPGTAFVVVAAPEPDALREAAYFVERLNGDRMPLAGLVVNRASPEPRGKLSAEEALAAAERIDARRGAGATGELTAGLLRLHADRMRSLAREAALRARFTAAHPGVATAVVPALASDVHDLRGLRRVGELLARR